MILVQIVWHVNPFRGETFNAGWAHAAEGVLDFGATSWGFYRAHDGRLDFIQQATFPTKADFERYWYSELVAEARTALAGLYQVPLLPTFWEIVGEGAAVVSPAPAAP